VKAREGNPQFLNLLDQDNLMIDGICWNLELEESIAA
jgi:hypothetical protein